MVIVVLNGEFVRYNLVVLGGNCSVKWRVCQYGLTVLGGNCSVKWRVCQIWFDCFKW